MSFSTTDPFTQVYRALWTYLEAESLLTSQVKLANRIKSDGDHRHPDKREKSTGDYPELALRPVSAPTGLTISSHGAAVTQAFNLELQTGEQRATEKLFPIHWAILRAMKAAEQADLGLDFVRKVNITGTSEADRDQTGEVQIGQWVAIFTIEVIIDLTNDDLTS